MKSEVIIKSQVQGKFSIYICQSKVIIFKVGKYIFMLKFSRPVLQLKSGFSSLLEYTSEITNATSGIE